jgi:hypothetical protein
MSVQTPGGDHPLGDFLNGHHDLLVGCTRGFLQQRPQTGEQSAFVVAFAFASLLSDPAWVATMYKGMRRTLERAPSRAPVSIGQAL